jgi:hypothetical protein
MTQQECRQMPIFPDVGWRMPVHDAIVGVEGVSGDAWLQAADVIVGEHRTRRAARRWIASIQLRYPGCLFAVARHRRGRWCLVGLPARNIVLRGGRFDLATAEQFGRIIYHLWAARR